MEKRFRFTVLMVLALAVGLTAGAANAELLVYEPFDYPEGESLEGQSGGDGWDGPWLRGWGPMPAIIAAGSLDHHGVPKSGNKVHLLHNPPPPSYSAGVYRDLPGDGLQEKDGLTYWVSFLVQKETADNAGSWIGMYISDALWVGKAYYKDNWGYDSWVYYDYRVEGDISATTLSWYVMKLEMTPAPGNNDITVWIDPDLVKAEPDTGSASLYLSGHYGASDIVDIILDWGEWGGGDGGVGSGWFDEIRIGTTWKDVAPNPNLASALQPADEATDVDPNTDANQGGTELEWTAPIGGASSYDVYFGTYYWGEPDPNFIIANAQLLNDSAATSVDPGSDLALDTDYYWRVDVDNTHTGFVWSFRTWGLAPIVTHVTDPNVLTVPPGNDAQLGVVSSGNVGTGHTYQWYKEGVGPALTNNGEYSGTTTDTLTIKDVQQGDEGRYLCRVTDVGSTDSDYFKLLTKRLMAHWKFEDNYNDETTAYHGEAADDTAEPNFVAGGIDGKAVQIWDPNRFVVVDTAIGLLNDITVSMWVKPNKRAGALFFVPQAGELEGYGGPGSVHLTGYMTTAYPAITFIGDVYDSMEANIHGLVEDVDAGEPNSLTVGEWNHIVFVYDTTNAVARYHVNGNQVKSLYYGQHQSIDGAYEQAIDASVLPNVLPLGIGSDNLVDMDISIGFDQGLIDDVRVYNYPLSPLEIAELYNAFAAVDTDCFRPVEGDVDDPPDCKVDGLDLKEMAEDWLLGYNIVPDNIAPDIPQ